MGMETAAESGVLPSPPSAQRVTFASLLPPSTPPSFPSCRNKVSATQLLKQPPLQSMCKACIVMIICKLHWAWTLLHCFLSCNLLRNLWGNGITDGSITSHLLHRVAPIPAEMKLSRTWTCQSDSWISALLRWGKNYIGFNLCSSWVSVAGWLPPPPPTIRLSSS